MESGLLPTINSQLIQLESESGARALRRDVLSAISTTLKRYTGSRERENLLLEILNLYNLFMACRPRMSLLIHDLQRLVVFLHEHADADAEALKQYVEVIRREKRAQMERCQTQLIDLLAGQRRVLLHSHSSTILGAFKIAAERQIRPEVLIAAQDPKKTNQVITALAASGHSFKVVSEYSVSHVLEDVDIALFGALSLTRNGQFIAGPGVANLINHLRVADVARYPVMTTDKFSFWESYTKPTYEETRAKRLEDLDYEKVVFSHDTFNIKSITALVTDLGILDHAGIERAFDTQQAEFFENERKIQQLQ